MVEAGLLTGAEVEASVREALAPLLGERDAAGEFVFPLPASAKVDTLLLGCTHYPLLRAAIAAVAGDGIAIVDSAAATASALAELLSINGLEAAPGGATHLQLTTGDVDAFRSIAERMFGEAFPDVAAIDLAAMGSAT
jgi:glutamate racemase